MVANGLAAGVSICAETSPARSANTDKVKILAVLFIFTFNFVFWFKNIIGFSVYPKMKKSLDL